MSTATASSAVSSAIDTATRTDSDRYVHRWFTTAHPHADRYDVVLVRYDLYERRNWCLTADSTWQEFQPGEHVEPFAQIDGIDLNPMLGRVNLGWRQLVRQSVATAVAPVLEQLLQAKSWLTYAEVMENLKDGRYDDGPLV